MSFFILAFVNLFVVVSLLWVIGFGWVVFASYIMMGNKRSGGGKGCDEVAFLREIISFFTIIVGWRLFCFSL